MLYQPDPITFKEDVLPDGLQRYMDWIGKQVHERWAANRIQDGWEYGEQYDGVHKKHPCLVSYEDLPESEREYDRSTARHTIQLLMYAGFRIIPPSEEKQNRKD